MAKQKLYWRNLTTGKGGRYRVRRTPTGWETAGGMVIWWHGNEAKQAQDYLSRREAGEATMRSLQGKEPMARIKKKVFQQDQSIARARRQAR